MKRKEFITRKTNRKEKRLTNTTRSQRNSTRRILSRERA